MTRFLTISACTLLLVARTGAGPTNVTTTATADKMCPAFTLRDQFDTQHEFKFPRAKPAVLVVADKKGSEEIKGWAQPLAERFGDQIDLPGLADVSAVPRSLRGMVQSKFRKAMTQPVMLDWEGKISGSFKYTKGQANVYLIGPDGRVLHHLAGRADEGKLADLGELIAAMLSPTNSSGQSPK